MLTLITGVPGAGKTSNTLWEFLQDTSGRPRFCTPIRGFDPIANGIGDLPSLEHWQDLPDGSLVLVDEAQQYLRPRKIGGQVPEWVAAFETHRHRGFDFLFITQNPGLIDSHVRKLIQSHVHYHRAFNLKGATRYQWEQIQPNPDLDGARAKALAKRVKPNPEVFKYYESTVLDTHKPKLPWKWILTLGGALLVVVAVGIGITQWMHRLGNKGKSEVVVSAGGAPVVASTPQSIPAKLAPMSIQGMTPRISGMPWTAPQYDNLTEPTDFPRIAACMYSPRTGCNCWTQQATPIETAFPVCMEVVKKGMFDPWLTGRADDHDRPGLHNGPDPKAFSKEAPKVASVDPPKAEASTPETVSP